jgi:aspartyl-tRNA(Asn)/glutamyl-tRNA(Gln) amidotransferase subunit A
MGPSSRPLHFEPLAALSRKIRAGECSPLQLTEAFLARIEKFEQRLGSFRLICPERALEQARAAETAIAAGRDCGPLHGIPFAVKDLYDVKGLPTSAGCSLLENNVAADYATVVRRLLDAGMVLVGKTNTVQFAYGGAGINHDHGTPRNPWHRVPHLPGGSSSGSGVAVAAGLVPMALGSDTGGSVRIPAALCGITGLKTTVGQVSRAGVYPLSWSLDSVGPLTRSVEDAALVYAAIAGPDRRDESTAAAKAASVMSQLNTGIEGLRIAFAESVFFDDVDPELEESCRASRTAFESLGAQVSSIPFEVAEQARNLNPRGLIIAAEAYTLNQRLLEDHFTELDPVVAHRMIKGKEVYAHEYLSTVLAWKRLRARMLETFHCVDAILCPATMVPALPVDEVDRDIESYSDANLKYLRNTSIGNVLDLCGLSVPCGFTSGGLPMGLMIYAKPFDEATLLRIGHAYQQATDWHRHTPDLD